MNLTKVDAASGRANQINELTGKQDGPSAQCPRNSVRKAFTPSGPVRDASVTPKRNANGTMTDLPFLPPLDPDEEEATPAN